jgi:hypothetical protein
MAKTKTTRGLAVTMIYVAERHDPRFFTRRRSIGGSARLS